MDTREKAASIATALNVTLTIVKFVLYSMTGSLAILAEAWHSLSDIATSALTFAAVRRTVIRERVEAAESPDATPPEPKSSEPGDAVSTRPLPSAEQVASLIISLVILVAGLTVVSKVLWYQAAPIAKPLLAGILFLVFSLGSYLVHRLEIDVGQRSGSAGLVADGMHARADMIASLLTGVSLILYHLGFNLDRLIAALIAALILSVAVETIVNLVVGYTRGQTQYVPHYRSHEILAKVLSLTWLVHAAGQLASHAGFGDLTSRLLPRFRRYLTAGIVVVIVVTYGRTCFFSVGLAQEGIVEHFGRPARLRVPPRPARQVALAD